MDFLLQSFYSVALERFLMRPHLTSSLLFCAYFLLLSAEINNDIIENGQSILEILKDVSDDGLGLYDELIVQALTTVEAAELINLVLLLTDAITKEEKERDSNEAKLLKKLDEKITQNFVKLSRQVHDELTSVVMPAQAFKYSIGINVALESIRQDLTYVLKWLSGAASQEARKIFKDKCISTASPWNILEKIETFIACRRMPAETIDLYLSSKALFLKLLKSKDNAHSQRDKLLLMDDYGLGEQYMQIFSLRNAHEFVLKIQQEVDQKKATFKNVDQVVEYLNSKLAGQAAEINFGGCFLEDFISKNQFKTNAALSMAIGIKKDIELAFIVGSFCIGFESKNDAGKKEKANKLIALFNRLTGFVSNRTLELLQATWPKIDMSYMQKAMDDLSYSNITTQKLQISAAHIWEKINSVGPKGFAKQVVLTAFGTRKDSYSLNCNPEFCISYNSSKNKVGKEGISGVVVRTPKPNFYIRSTAQWSEINRAQIMNIIHEYATVPNNAEILASVQHVIGNIISQDHSHAFLLVRDSPYFATNCVNNYAALKYSQLPIHANETLNKWKYGITTFHDYQGVGWLSSAICTSLYVIA